MSPPCPESVDTGAQCLPQLTLLNTPSLPPVSQEPDLCHSHITYQWPWPSLALSRAQHRLLVTGPSAPALGWDTSLYW